MFYYLRPQGQGRRGRGGRGGFGGGRGRNFNNNRDNNRDRRENREENMDKSTSTIYVSNLPFSVDDAQLARIFKKYQVKTSHVVQSLSGRSRGFGFVEFETEEDQNLAVQEMDNVEVKGSDDKPRNIAVKVALVERQKQPQSENSDDKKD